MSTEKPHTETLEELVRKELVRERRERREWWLRVAKRTGVVVLGTAVLAGLAHVIYSSGYHNGHVKGHRDGYDNGYARGRLFGYDDGYDSALKACSKWK